MVKYDTVLIRYGELSTKGKNRKTFVQKLLSNIKHTLKDMPNLEYRVTYERIYIKKSYKNIPCINCYAFINSNNIFAN